MGAFTNRKTIVANGAITFTGNTVGLSKKENSQDAGTAHSIGAYITNDNLQTPVTTYPGPIATPFYQGTTLSIPNNGSVAYLNLPTGSTILYADLVWSGSYQTSGENNSTLINNSVSFTMSGTDASVSTTIKPVTQYTVTGPPSYYLNLTEVTSILKGALISPATTFDGLSYKIVCDGIVGTTDPNNNTDNACGWTLCVIYGNPTLPSRNMSLYSGNTTTFVGSGNTVTATVSGFETPTSGSVNGRILFTACEGDAVLTGDQTSITDSSNVFHNLSGPNNLVNNFFASQINNDAGFVDTTGSYGNYNQNPNGTNIVGGRQGWDITNVNANPFPFVNLNNGQTTTTVKCTSDGDRYWVTELGIQLDINAPLLQIVKIPDKTTAVLNDIIQYEIRITNTGTANAYNLIFDDDVPPNTTYVPGSVSVTGASADTSLFPTKITINSILAPGAPAIVIKYSVRITNLPPSRTIVNFSDITYSFDGPEGETLTGNAQSNPVTTALIPPVPPVVPNYSVETCKNAPVSGTVSGIDINGNYPLKYLISTNPSHGFVSIGVNSGIWTYTPIAGYSGIDSFVVVVIDSQGVAAFSTVTINILDISCSKFRCKQCVCKSNCCN